MDIYQKLIESSKAIIADETYGATIICMPCGSIIHASEIIIDGEKLLCPICKEDICA